MKPFLRSAFLLFLGAFQAAGGPLDPALIRFSQSLTYQTTEHNLAEFQRFQAFLRGAFPLVHQKLEHQIIGSAGLLFKWPGTRPALKPVILLAHQDVVEAGTSPWKQPPFSGALADGFVWGRGARDCKPNLMAILEGAESLLRSGFWPERDLYFAFGSDEESLGYEGAGRIARHLGERGVKAEFILDEGGGVTVGTIGGIDRNRPVAIISVAEKGYLSLDLRVEGSGGHSASEGPGNPVLVLGEALRRVEANPFPSQLREPMPSMLRSLGRGMGFWKRMAFSHLWLTGGLVKRMMEADHDARPMVRTTCVATRFESGIRDNVVPDRATAVLNLRLLPGWTIQQAIAHIRKSVGDPRVQIAIRGPVSEVPPVSPIDTPAYGRLSGVIQRVFPGALVAPALLAGATDIRHYAGVSPNLYRFAPSVNTRTFSGNGHAADERLPVENYRQYLAFYTALLCECGKAWN